MYVGGAVISTAAPPLLEALLERLQSKEVLDWEVKAARNNLPSSLWETVSAFANTQGGWILLGIAQHDETSSLKVSITRTK